MLPTRGGGGKKAFLSVGGSIAAAEGGTSKGSEHDLDAVLGEVKAAETRAAAI